MLIRYSRAINTVILPDFALRAGNFRNRTMAGGWVRCTGAGARQYGGQRPPEATVPPTPAMLLERSLEGLHGRNIKMRIYLILWETFN